MTRRATAKLKRTTRSAAVKRAALRRKVLRGTPRNTAKVNDLYAMLKKDHEKVKQMFNAIISGKATRDTFEELARELRNHMQLEEEYLYPVLEEHEISKDIAMHADEEHLAAKNLILEIENLEYDNERWIPKLEVLRGSVEHHIEHEEGEIFKKMKKVLSREVTQEIVEQIMDEKTRMHQENPELLRAAI